MSASTLALPTRAAKPRVRGLTILIDPGLPVHYFEDVIESAGSYIDLVKFGWGTAIVTERLEEKIACLRRNGVDYFFGGTLFEKFYRQRKISDFYAMCKQYDCRYVEISNGTIDLTNEDKARIITHFASEFNVLSEVGYKDSDRSQMLPPSAWITYIREDLAAGAQKVITEARESGTSGICRPDGELRYGLIEDILTSGIDSNALIFEAPNKSLQTTFIRRLGSDVNLANIAFSDIISLETLRLGLRSDTLETFESDPTEHTRRL
ncbi:MAG TPA: phosphosulfolactate synthase [Ktedonobacterales bacterium]|nr:phosphosulfolactate synthase [Ktedonobacterales bacterium]